MDEPPQPEQQPQPQPQIVYQYVGGPPTNTYAILAAIFAFVVFPPLGIYFGYKAREQIAATGERGSELATVGIVAGWILTALYGVFMLVWCGFAVAFGGGFLLGLT
jgi:hypothetical protein